MPVPRDINIFLLAQMQLNRDQVRLWLDSIGAKEFTLPEGATDSETLVGLAAKRCYMSFEVGLNPNVQRVRTDWVEYLDNVLKSRHGSVIEHAHWTYAFEGVSRVFTGEMNRHRHTAISEGSMRFIRFAPQYDENGDPMPGTGIPFWMPECIRDKESDDARLRAKKERSRDVFMRAFASDEMFYKELADIWKDELDEKSTFRNKKNVTSMMRRVVGMGVSTGVVYTINARSVRSIMELRASEAAEEEILHVWSRVGKMMFQREDKLFGDFTQTPDGFWVPKYSKI